MILTTGHSESSYGIPVFVEDGKVIDYCDGIKRLLKIISDREGLCSIPKARATLAKKTNVSARTVQGWEQGRRPSPSALMAMHYELNDYLII